MCPVETASGSTGGDGGSGDGDISVPVPDALPCIVCPNCFSAEPRVTTRCLISVTASWTSKSPGYSFASSSKRKKIGFRPANSVTWPTC